jgi:glycerol-3-phosphate acyltransferase PlsY
LPDSEVPPIPLSIALILLSFLCGSLPFAVWLGKIFRRADPRQFGDGNPGATNAFRAGGLLVGLLVLMLDISKGAAPIGLSYFNLGVRGLPMFLIATAALLGHAFSPFLGFKGGKGLAVALGVWIGLTLWRMSVPALALVLFWNALLDAAGWAVMLTLGGMAVLLIAWMPDPLLLAVLSGQAIILAWTHRADLCRRPHLRPWLATRLSS